LVLLVALIGISFFVNAQDRFRGEPSLCYYEEKITFYNDFTFKLWENGVLVLSGTYKYNKAKGVIDCTTRNGDEFQMKSVVEQHGVLQRATFRGYFWNHC